MAALSADHEFQEWTVSHGKAYANRNEYLRRFAMFLMRKMELDKIRATEPTFEVELNQFADMTPAEVVASFTGVRMDNLLADVPEDTEEPPVKALTAVDNRKYFTVRDQASCGSCWAFSAIGILEGLYKKNTGSYQALSPQHMVDCVKKCSGCNGGHTYLAFNYYTDNKTGVPTEASYPYTAKDGTCKSHTPKARADDHATVTNKSEDTLKSYLSSYTGVGVYIYASLASFQSYKSGIYYDANCQNKGYNHAVTAVGYASDGSTEYFIVMNSWGKSWGQSGYIYMKAGVNNCGITSRYTYAKSITKW